MSASRFSPAAADLAITSPTGKPSFPTERVAYVGFHQPGGPPLPPSAHRGALKLHISSGVGHTCRPDPEPASPLGFHAKPAEGLSPFKEIFLYNPGIQLRELNEPLGEMLLRDGRVGASAPEKGLAAQKGQARTQIGQILIEHKRVDSGAIEQATQLQKRRVCETIGGGRHASRCPNQSGRSGVSVGRDS